MLPDPAPEIPERFLTELRGSDCPHVQAGLADPRRRAAAALAGAAGKARGAGYYAKCFASFAAEPGRVDRLLRERRAGRAEGPQGRTPRPAGPPPRVTGRDNAGRWDHPVRIFQHCAAELAGVLERWPLDRQGAVLCDAIEAFEARARNDRGTGLLDRWGRVARFERPADPADAFAAAEDWIDAIRANAMLTQDFTTELRITTLLHQRGLASAG